MRQIFFDGATGPSNPGHGGAGWVIYSNDKEPMGSYIYLGENRTNNESEYAALYYSLKHGIVLGIENERIEIYGDSQLVVNQVNGEWKNKKLHLQKLMAKVQGLLDLYSDYSLQWIPREKNEVADECSNMALRSAGIRAFKRL